MVSRLGRIVGALALALTVSGPALARDNAVVAGLASDVATLDPSIDQAVISLHARLNIFDALTEIARDGSAAPRLAMSWEASPDATVWTFTIRTNAKFHNGQPVTIDDVIWTYKKILDDAKSPVRTFIAKVKSVERVADDKVRFTLSDPVAPFQRQVSLISILPQKAYEDMGAAKFGQSPIGSGPYKLVRWVKDDRIELAAFADYWDGAPKLASAVLKPIPAEASRASALLSGEIDIVPSLPPAMVDRLSAQSSIKVEKSESYKVVYLGFNETAAPLNSLKLRQAIDRAIDRETITTKLLRGLGKPIGQIVAPMSFGYDPAIKPTLYDVAGAKQLVAESGYKGEKILFQYPNNFIASSEEVAQAIAGYLGAIGVNLELQGMDYNAFYALWSGRKLSGMHMFVFGPILMDADAPLTSIYSSAGQRGYWSDPKIDALITEQRATGDLAKRRALIGEIWRLSRENLPYAMLYNEMQASGLRDGVTWSPRADGILRLREVTVRQ